MNKKISIIIPALNEEVGIKKTIQNIPLQKLKENGYKVEILVVDNNSGDRTNQNAVNLGAKVVKESKIGYGYAYQTGFNNASGDIFVMCDGDNQYPIKETADLLKIFTSQKLDFLTTNRFNKRFTNEFIPLSNRIGNSFLTLIFNLFYQIPLKDSQSGMMVISRKLAKQLKLNSNQMSFSEEVKIETIFYQKCKWREVDIQCIPRLNGKSKIKIIHHGLDNLFFLIKKRLCRYV